MGFEPFDYFVIWKKNSVKELREKGIRVTMWPLWEALSHRIWMFLSIFTVNFHCIGRWILVMASATSVIVWHGRFAGRKQTTVKILKHFGTHFFLSEVSNGANSWIKQGKLVVIFWIWHFDWDFILVGPPFNGLWSALTDSMTF